MEKTGLPTACVPDDKSHRRQIFLPRNLADGHHVRGHMIQVVSLVFCTVTSLIATSSLVWGCPPLPNSTCTTLYRKFKGAMSAMSAIFCI